jgi:hypothetical protein
LLPSYLLALSTCVLILAGCSHPAEQALQGVWLGQAVENFDDEAIAAATGWAKGTQFEFNGSRLTVTVPAEEPRSGTYRLSSIENRHVTLTVLDSRGDLAEMELIVDDAENLRWVLEDGRTMLLKRK